MSSKKYLRLFDHDDATVIDLGDMEIWDGADIALLRDSLVRLAAQKPAAIGIDMSYVKYIPSGFFGMLFDYHDLRFKIQLVSPQPNVIRMLWFRRFFKQVAPNVYQFFPNNEIPQAPVVEPLTTNVREQSTAILNGNGAHPSIAKAPPNNGKDAAMKH